MTLTPEERVEHVTIAPEEVLEGERSSLVTGTGRGGNARPPSTPISGHVRGTNAVG